MSSSSEVDLSHLSAEQQESLQTYISITEQEISQALPLLERSQWNVQFAVTKFFDGEAPDPLEEARAIERENSSSSAGQTHNLMEELESTPIGSAGSPFSAFGRSNFDSLRPEPAPRLTNQPLDNGPLYRPPLILTLLFTPLSLAYRIISSTFGLIGSIFPFIPRLLHTLYSPILRRLQLNTSTTTFYRRPLGPVDTAIRFKREFQEEFGHDSDGGEDEDIPFMENGYTTASEKAHSQSKFLLVMLFSMEHEHVRPWILNTLLSPAVKNLFRENRDKLLVWAGNVRDAEAYRVSIALHTTTFPFVALLAHTPGVSSSPMSIISRLPGLTTPEEFCEKLQAAMRKYEAPLARVRAQRAEQTAARNLRQQQDAAYERSLAQDRERARQKREKDEEEQRKREAREKYLRNLEVWRKWRASKLPSEPASSSHSSARIAIKFPSGERVIRRFDGTCQIEEVYAFVECFDVLKAMAEGSRDADASVGDGSHPPEEFDHKYEFQLVSPMPRTVIDIASGGTIGDRIGRGGNLVVETINADAEEDNEEDEKEA